MAANDSWTGRNTGVSDPFRHTEDVTPHDTNELTEVSRALWIGTGGNVTLKTAGGETSTFANVPSGTWIPGFISQVFATGTTASNIVAVR